MGDRPGPRQLPLALGHSTAATRDDLAVSEANRHAVELIERWPAWPSPVVILSGPSGSGKSHLAAIWKHRAQAAEFSGSNIPPDAFGPEAVPATLIDHIDAAAIDENGLFHLINAVQARGGHLLLVGRGSPSNWNVSLPDLRSRLRAATATELGAPEEELLTAVIAKLFADRQVEVEPHVVQFLVRRMDRSLAEAVRVVAALDRLSLEGKRPITRSLANSVLSERDAPRDTDND